MIKVTPAAFKNYSARLEVEKKESAKNVKTLKLRKAD